MRKKIGIALWAHPHYGGVFQYSLSIMNAAAGLDRSRYDITIFYRHEAWTQYMQEEPGNSFSWVPYYANIPLMALGMTCRIAERNKLLLDMYKRMHSLYHRALKCGIDLMVYPAPIPLSFEIGIPYMISVHDLQHRLHPEFPEVSRYGEWGRREYLFKNCSRNAAAVIAESETGKKDIVHFYDVPENRIHVLPYVSPHYLAHNRPVDVINKYGLPDRYLFYPAQFWMHKNHMRLVEALAFIKQERGTEIPIVFVGSRKNAYKQTMKRISELGLSRQVFYLGYVPEEDMVGLYRTAHALVMPTFFGPSNIPQLEAFLLGCPVITSNVPGINEQVGDAALQVRPDSVESIAAGIITLWTDDAIRQDLIRKGYAHVSSWTSERFGKAFQQFVESAMQQLKKPGRGFTI